MLQVYQLERDDSMLLLRNSLNQLTTIHPMLRSTHSALEEFSIRDCVHYVLDEEALRAADETRCAGLCEVRQLACLKAWIGSEGCDALQWLSER